MLRVSGAVHKEEECWLRGSPFSWLLQNRILGRRLRSGKPATNEELFSATFCGWTPFQFSGKPSHRALLKLKTSLDDSSEPLMDNATIRKTLCVCVNAITRKVPVVAEMRTATRFVAHCLNALVDKITPCVTLDKHVAELLLCAFDCIYALIQFLAPLRECAVDDAIVVERMQESAKLIADNLVLSAFTFGIAIHKLILEDLCVGGSEAVKVVIDALAVATSRRDHHLSCVIALAVERVHSFEVSEPRNWFPAVIGAVLVKPQTSDCMKLAAFLKMRWKFDAKEVGFHVEDCSQRLHDIIMSGALSTRPKDTRCLMTEYSVLHLKTILRLLHTVTGHLHSLNLRQYRIHLSTGALFHGAYDCLFPHSRAVRCECCIEYECCAATWLHSTESSQRFVSTIVRRKAEERHVTRTTAEGIHSRLRHDDFKDDVEEDTCDSVDKVTSASLAKRRLTKSMGGIAEEHSLMRSPLLISALKPETDEETAEGSAARTRLPIGGGYFECDCDSSEITLSEPSSAKLSPPDTVVRTDDVKDDNVEEDVIRDGGVEDAPVKYWLNPPTVIHSRLALECIPGITVESGSSFRERYARRREMASASAKPLLELMATKPEIGTHIPDEEVSYEVKDEFTVKKMSSSKGTAAVSDGSSMSDDTMERPIDELKQKTEIYISDSEMKQFSGFE